ncbi:MAG: hypothetical protein MJK04_23935 [Psychrosphaera sp.]|nr:hypothetical protein [Psychrosphaera sp.]
MTDNNELTCAQKLDNLDKKHADVREEIKQRIVQRDKYVIQSAVSTVVLLALAYKKDGNINVLLLLPPMYLYYTYLLEYSYQIHRSLSSYLRDVVEKRMSELMPHPTDSKYMYIETYFAHRKGKDGIRSKFFLFVFPFIWLMCFTLLSRGYLLPDYPNGWDMLLFFAVMLGTLALYCRLMTLNGKSNY